MLSIIVLSRTIREFDQFGLKMFALGQEDGRIGPPHLSSYRHSNFSGHAWTKVSLWEVWVPGRRLQKPNAAAENGCAKAHQRRHTCVHVC